MQNELLIKETQYKEHEYRSSVNEKDVPLEIYWCENCKAPIIKYSSDIDKNLCPSCKHTTSYLCADLRPVFPEERLLLEIIHGRPLAYIKKSVWASNNRYYIDGKPIAVTMKTYMKLSPKDIRGQLELYKGKNSYDFLIPTLRNS